MSEHPISASQMTPSSVSIDSMMSGLNPVKEQFEFAQLRLMVGEPIKLETRNPRGRYGVRFLGAYPQQGLLLSAPVLNESVKSLKVGTKLRLRFVAQQRACAFSSRVLKLEHTPAPMLWIEYPDQVEAVRIQQRPRVEAQLIVSVDEVDAGNFGGGWPRQALCADLSLEGARIEAGDQLGEIDDGLFITLRVQVGGVDQVMLLEARIRALEEIEDGFDSSGKADLGAGMRMVHGVEFSGMDEETRLILSGFIYQQQLLQLLGPEL